MDVAAVARERMATQLLAEPTATDPVGVVRHLLAVQAQDPRGARLAIRSRSTGLTAAAVDRALTMDRSLVVSWLNRSTLHLVCVEDFPWLHALTTPQSATGNRRRLAEEGVSPAAAERGVAAVEAALTAEGPLTREQLRERVAAADVPVQGQALIHLLVAATLQGLIVRGPMVGSQQAFVLVRDWLDPAPPVDRAVALAELGRRYLVGHGPAAAADLAKWAGITLGDARRALSSVVGLVERDDGLAALATDRSPVAPPPRLLGTFEPLLLGWASREAFLVGHTELVTVNGIFKAFALVDGVAAATWGLADGKISIDPFDALPAEVRTALDVDADDVVRFLAPAGRPP